MSRSVTPLSLQVRSWRTHEQPPIRSRRRCWTPTGSSLDRGRLTCDARVLVTGRIGFRHPTPLWGRQPPGEFPGQQHDRVFAPHKLEPWISATPGLADHETSRSRRRTAFRAPTGERKAPRAGLGGGRGALSAPHHAILQATRTARAVTSTPSKSSSPRAPAPAATPISLVPRFTASSAQPGLA
jgi:hypothetical protein